MNDVFLPVCMFPFFVPVPNTVSLDPKSLDFSEHFFLFSELLLTKKSRPPPLQNPVFAPGSFYSFKMFDFFAKSFSIPGKRLIKDHRFQN